MATTTPRPPATGRTSNCALTTDMRIGFEGSRATARTLMKEGDTLFVALSWSKHPPPADLREAYERLVWTAHHWQHWLDHGNFPDHPWRTHLQRSALTLKGLSYAPTGALVAAATTSLPETPGGERNWDYRYTWIRDATFMLWGLYTLGFDWEANDFFYFIADVAEAEEGQLQIMYGIGGEARASRGDARPPVRLRGREAGAGRQRRLPPGSARRLGRDPRLVLPAHQVPRPSAGAHLADPRAAGRDRARQLAREGPRHLGGAWRAQALHLLEAHVLGRGRPRRAARRDSRGSRVRDPLAVGGRRDPCRHLRASARRSGVFCQHYETDALDASVLLMPLVRFLPPEDERIRTTVLAIADELTIDGLVLRYRTEETDDGLAGEEGSFTICSFWLVSALVEIGEIKRAPGPLREAPLATPARSACTPRRSTRAPGATWGTSRRPSPTWR